MTPTSPTSGLIINSRPTNLRLMNEFNHAFIDGDMLDICGRIAEYSASHGQRLSIVQLDPTHFAVVETNRAGVEELVFRVGEGCEIDALDGRVIEKLNYIRTVPASERMRRLDIELEREQEAKRAETSERMWEKMGAPLYSNLSKLGFIHEPRVESIRPLNKTARRAGRRMA